MAVNQAEHLAEEGGAQIEGERIQGGEGREGIRVRSAAGGFVGHHGGGAGR